MCPVAAATPQLYKSTFQRESSNQNPVPGSALEKVAWETSGTQILLLLRDFQSRVMRLSSVACCASDFACGVSGLQRWSCCVSCANDGQNQEVRTLGNILEMAASSKIRRLGDTHAVAHTTTPLDAAIIAALKGCAQRAVGTWREEKTSPI